jgi:hypothetical protein
MRRFSSSTSGGLLSTFASPAFLGKEDTTLPPTRRDLTIIRDRKRIRSRLDIGSCRFDSLALIPCDEETLKNDEYNPKGKQKRERSRPREIDRQVRTSSNADTGNDSFQQEKNTTIDDHETKNQQRSTAIHPGISHYKRVQRTSEVFETDQGEDIDMQSIDYDNDNSIVHHENSTHGASDGSYRDLYRGKKNRELKEEVVVTPIKTRNGNDMKSDGRRFFHDKQSIVRSSNSIDIVTPSPTRPRSKQQNRKRQNSVTASDVPGSIMMSNKRRQLKRVSKLRSTSVKKPVVALTQAITVGNKTIPARQNVCAPEGKKQETKPVSNKGTRTISATKSFCTDHVTKGLDPKYSSKKTNEDCSMGGIITGFDWGKRNSTTRASKKTCNDFSDTSLTRIIPKMKYKKLPKHPTISGDTQEQPKSYTTTTTTKKMAILDFIEEMISKLNDLKDDVKNICKDDEFLVDITELRKRYTPLSHVDLFPHTVSDKDTIPNELIDGNRPSWIGMKPVPPKPSPPLQTWKSNTLHSHFFNPSNEDGEESCCESVIDLGTILDPHALVKYAYTKQVYPNDSNENEDGSKSTNHDSDDDDDDDNDSTLSDQSLGMQSKREGGKSRIHNSTSDILATFATVTPQSKEETTLSNHHSKEKNQPSAALTSPKTIPVVDSINKEESSLSVDQTIHDRFRELFELDHDELIQNELIARSVPYLVRNALNPAADESIINDNHCGSSNEYVDESSWDDLFLSIPTISY